MEESKIRSKSLFCIIGKPVILITYIREHKVDFVGKIE